LGTSTRSVALIVPRKSPGNASAGPAPDGATIDRLPNHSEKTGSPLRACPDGSYGSFTPPLLVANELLIPVGASPTEIHVEKLSGTPGNDPGWDLASIIGQLNITATASNPFEIDINSLDLFNSPGPLSGMVINNTYSWTIASATGGITGFSQSVFSLNTAGFTAPLNGSFSISQIGNNLNLQFTAVPEPSTMIILGLAMVALFVGSRRRRLQLA